MKSWKKQLNKEFDNATPALKEEIKKAPIITTTEVESDVLQNGNALIRRRVKIGSFVAALLAIVFAVMYSFGIFKPPVAKGFDKFIFSLEINPAVAFVTDKDGVVVDVKSLNEDADVVLYNESTLNNLKNKPLSQAIVTYTDSAAQLGYLNLNAVKSAVRLSNSVEADKDVIADASKNLQEYFMSKGVYTVVVEETLSVKELCKRMNVNEEKNLADLTTSLENISSRFGERVDIDIDAEKLKNLYKENIIGHKTLELVCKELLENLNDIILNAQMLQNIRSCNYEIMTHKDNPYSPIPLDYFSIKKNYTKDFTADFKTLMLKMERLLSEYEEKFGSSIESFEALKAAVEPYSFLPSVSFNEVFSAVTLSDFHASAKKYITILKNIGCDVTALESFLKEPKNAQEYILQFQTVLSQLFQSRVAQFKEVYDRPRNNISKSEYDVFVNNILSEYGSLKNFWEKIK